MDTQLAAAAQNCLDAAYEGTMAFPEIVGTLIESVFEGYVVDYRRNTTTYFLPEGDSVVLENRPSEAQVASAAGLKLWKQYRRSRRPPGILSSGRSCRYLVRGGAPLSIPRPSPRNQITNRWQNEHRGPVDRFRHTSFRTGHGLD